jgi:hypothetical protein
MVDLFLVYKFIRQLTKSFVNWDAYKEGIIDKDGKILIKRKDLKTQKEKSAFGVLELMILNIKNLLAKLPGNGKLGSYSAALWLIREWNHFSDDTLLTEDITDDQIHRSVAKFNRCYTHYIIEAENVNDYFKLNEKKINEEPTVSAGSGNIAGIGVGPDGEPPKPKKKLKDVMRRNK